MEKKSHSLTIYLIKKGYNDVENIIADKYKKESNKITINNIGDLFYRKSFSSQSKWITHLFSENDLTKLFSSSASAAFLVKIGERFFTVCFGPAGRYILRKGVIEERFGLITTLNSVKSNSIRSIDTKTLEIEPIQTRIQASRATSKDNFGIDIQRDLVNSVSGVPKDDRLGKCIVGKDSLRVTLKLSLDEIKDYLKLFLTLYNKKDYKKDFGWIDTMKEEKDPSRINFLNEKLIEEINKEKPERLWLSIPEIIDWNDLDGFKYSENEAEGARDDIHVTGFKKFLSNKRGRNKKISMSDLILNYVYLYTLSAASKFSSRHWKAYNCIYFEYHQDNQNVYFLNDSKWYQVKVPLVEEISKIFDSIPQNTTGINFIDFNHKQESTYNKEFAKVNNCLCLDKDEVMIGGGYSRVEICDIYSSKRQLIHIKRYSGSGALSHLFNQGLVSANLLFDTDFRQKFNGKIKKLDTSGRFKIKNIKNKPNKNGENYEVVFGIISKFSKNNLNIPFFSKLSLSNVYNNLSNLGYRVSMVKINNIRKK